MARTQILIESIKLNNKWYKIDYSRSSIDIELSTVVLLLDFFLGMSRTTNMNWSKTIETMFFCSYKRLNIIFPGKKNIDNKLIMKDLRTVRRWLKQHDNMTYPVPEACIPVHNQDIDIISIARTNHYRVIDGILHSFEQMGIRARIHDTLTMIELSS